MPFKKYVQKPLAIMLAFVFVSMLIPVTAHAALILKLDAGLIDNF